MTTHTNVITSLRQAGSWVIRRRETLRGLAEVFTKPSAADLGADFEAVPAAQYLSELNAAIKAGDPRVAAERITNQSANRLERETW